VHLFQFRALGFSVPIYDEKLMWYFRKTPSHTYRSVFIPRHELDDSKSALDVQSSSLDLQIIRFVVELGNPKFIVGLGKLASSRFRHLYSTYLATISSVSLGYCRFLLDAMLAASIEPPTMDLWNVRALQPLQKRLRNAWRRLWYRLPSRKKYQFLCDW
jgi:hypothetical protein